MDNIAIELRQITAKEFYYASNALMQGFVLRDSEWVPFIIDPDNEFPGETIRVIVGGMQNDHDLLLSTELVIVVQLKELTL